MVSSDDIWLPASERFVPPSIHHADLLAGASYAHYSSVPSLLSNTRPNGVEPSCGTATACVLGIDEAGRGPVLGPMVYGGFYLPIELQQSLLATTHHFDDSKVLTPAVRASLMKSVCAETTDLFQCCGWAIKSLSARDIGAGMLQNGGSYNLNVQAMDATVEIIRGVMELGVNVREVFIDTIGIPSVYQKKLERIFPTVHITVEKKADSLFPCVSAASVVAKVTRDVSCEMLYEGLGRHTVTGASEGFEPGWGSGYPSDARCVSWLKSQVDPVFGWGNECRFSWGTIKDLMEVRPPVTVKASWQLDDSEETARLSDYFVVGQHVAGMRTDGDQLRAWYGKGVGQESF